eukprot:COSAG05_NODE_19324_length_294_cov_1.061538_1_plen_69_part_10
MWIPDTSCAGWPLPDASESEREGPPRGAADAPPISDRLPRLTRLIPLAFLPGYAARNMGARRGASCRRP